MVGRCIELETGAKDRFASKVAGWCGQPGSCRMKSGKHGRPGRGTERAGGVSPFKKHSPFGESFKIRSFIKHGVAIKGGVRPAQVVGHDKNDVGFCRECRTKQKKEREGMQEEVLRTEIHMV